MSQSIYFHIGPYKTGSTAIQHWLYTNRSILRAHRWLYPESGVVTKNSRWGERHLHLFRSKDNHTIWSQLKTEIHNSSASNIIVSSERVCQDINSLLSKSPFFGTYKPKVVIYVREEASMIKSFYLQVIKSRVLKKKNLLEGEKLKDFSQFFAKVGHYFCYPKILGAWIKKYGEESVIYVPYLNAKGYDCRSALAKSLGLPQCEYIETPSLNHSIKAYTAFNCIQAAKNGISNKDIAKIMNKLSRLEAKTDIFKEWPIDGYSELNVRAYYQDINKEFILKNKRFGLAYDQATATVKTF